jgi:hypothetical protein
VNKQSHVLIARYINSHPDLSWQEVATFFSVSMSTISRIAKEAGLGRPAVLDETHIASRVSGEEKSSE